MRIFRSTTIAAFCAALTLLLTTSCDHKELCFHHPHVQDLTIVYDWRDAPEAHPQGMVVYFYPINDENDPAAQSEFSGYQNTEAIRADLSPEGGKVVGLLPGRYRIITYNNDTNGVRFANEDFFDTHLGYTREGSVLEPLYGNASNRAPKAEGAEDERCVITPDPMWGCSVAEIEVSEQGVTYIHHPFDPDSDATTDITPVVTHHVITLFPHPLFCYYTYEIRNVKNLDKALQMTCTLSGMAPALYFSSEEMHRETVTLPFGATSDGVSKITGEFYTWGHHELNTQPHKLGMYIWMKGEAKGWFYSFDVTDQVHSAPNRRRVHLIVDGVELPQPIETEGGGGFTPSIDDWVDNEQDIVM